MASVMRRRSTRLWLLAGVLGAATAYQAAAMIHDTSEVRAAARMAARAAAERIAAHAGTLLDVMALQMFAPVAPWAASRPMTESPVALLAAWQVQGEQCRCRDLLPVTGFFHYDPLGDVLETRAVSAERGLPGREVLLAASRSEASRPGAGRRLRSHFQAGEALGGAGIVTMVQVDSAGRPAAVYGAIGDARALLHRLMAPHPVGRGETPAVVPQPEHAIVIGRGDSVPLLGEPPEGRITETIHPVGPLEGLTVSASITLGHFLSVHPLGPRRSQLWSLGALMASTVVVVVLAGGSLRREAQLAQARSDFVAAVSHDLRMPLAQLLLAGETLVENRARDEGERAALLKSMLRETRRLAGLVENVLLVSRTGRMTLTPDLRAVETEALFQDVAEAVGLAVEDAGHRLELDGGGLAVRGDVRLLRQALVNLVDNALKYGSPGQAIRIGATSHGERIRLTVADEGPGVPPELRGRMFESYQRLPRDQASERTGTGIGLAVVRQVAEACGGRVWMEDAEGRGTRVVMELPRA